MSEETDKAEVEARNDYPAIRVRHDDLIQVAYEVRRLHRAKEFASAADELDSFLTAEAAALHEHASQSAAEAASLACRLRSEPRARAGVAPEPESAGSSTGPVEDVVASARAAFECLISKSTRRALDHLKLAVAIVECLMDPDLEDE